MQHYVEMELEYNDYIEHWFQTTTRARHHSLLQKFLVLYHLQLLIFHAHIHFVKLEHEYIFVHDPHMASLEVLLHLKEDLFSLVE